MRYLYRCNRGFRLVGGYALRYCQRSGRWSGPEPKCDIMPSRFCSRPDKPKHGSYIGRRFIVDSTVTYYCNRGYKLFGRDERTCRRNGKWSGVTPKCQRKGKKCKPPGVPTNGHRLGRTFRVGTNVRFVCNKGYELVGRDRLVCQRNRKWSGKVPTCQVPDPLKNLKRVADDLRRHFVDKMELLTSDSRARSGLSSGAAGLDLVFVFDSSASVGTSNFRKGIAFAKTIIDEFGISGSPMGTRVAVVTFDTTARIVFNLVTNKIVNKAEAIRQLENLQFQGGGTATKLALNLVLRDVVPETRNNSKKALFLITDGKSNTGGDPEEDARFLRDTYDFEIFAIGVSGSVNKKELESIASEPFRTHVYLLKDFESLVKLKELITAKGTDYDDCGVAGITQLRDRKLFRIVGGVTSKAGAWPWLAAIYIRGSFRCGGALIGRKWVLTAAHCFHYDGRLNASDVLVRLGEHNRRLEEGTEQNVLSGKIHVHRKSGAGKLDYDIALIELQTAVKLTAYVRTICLPMKQDKVLMRANQHALIAGWGHTKHVKPDKPAGGTHPLLHQVEIPFVSHSVCRPASSFSITDRMVCAGDGTGQRDACKGDSGSPLVVKRANGHWTVVGIASWGEGCAVPGKYGVYTNVLTERYINWIWRKSRILPREA